METAFNASLVILIILYTALVMVYVWVFAVGPDRLGRLARPLLLATVSVHIVSLGLRSVMLEACPLGSRAEFMALVAFSIAVIYLILELRIGERSTGVFVIAPAFLLQVLASLQILGAARPDPPELGVSESIHTFAAIVGFSGVALCTVYGYLYLFLYLAIKKGMFGLFYRKMPPLETLSDQIFVGMWIAFLALSVTVGLGLWQNRSAEWSVSFTQTEVILTLVLWLLYGTTILGRHFLGLGGKRFAYVTALGLFPLIGILVGTLFAQRFHG